MAEVFIIPRNHTGGTNDDFVGMKFGSRDGKAVVDAIFPHGYKHSDKNNQEALKRELYSLLGTIKRYSRNAGQELHGTHGQTVDFPYDAYITIIKAFMQYGYYIESEIKYTSASVGNINWKRTIVAIKPLVQNNSPIYTDFIIRRNEKKTDKLISLIHEWCVYEAFEKLGWIFTAFNPHKPVLKITDDTKPYFISVIRDTLKTTFNDRNKLLFNAMIAMLKFERSEHMNAFFLGTTHFHTVWENLIDITYGISDVEKREYFPPARWHFANGRTGENRLLPDTIMQVDDSDEIFVLDAKYYSFALNFSVPAASDINKQITYGEYARKKKQKAVYNAFIIPYDFDGDPQGFWTGKIDEYAYIGYAVMEDINGNETHEKVLGILIDTKWIIESVGNIKRIGLAKFIKDKFHEINNS